MANEPPSIDREIRHAMYWTHTMQQKLGFPSQEGVGRKVVEEAQEFSDEQSLEEAADIIITIAAALVHHGWSPDDLAYAIQQKMMKNERRRWRLTEEGFWKHTEGDATND